MIRVVPSLLLFCCQHGMGDEPLPDPIPLRRQIVPWERLPAELDRVERGILARMPRKDFEQLVQRAAYVTQQLKNPPRLIHASYRAQLRDGALMGTGEWRVFNPASGAAVLPIQPLNLALQKCRIQSGSAEPADAVIGNLEGGNLGLLIDAPGEHTVYLDWSIRGERESGVLNFCFHVPAATTASIELNVPAGRTVTAERASCWLTGPHPAETPDRRIWRADFPGVSTLKFSLTQIPEASGRQIPVLTDASQTHELGTDGVWSEFGFSFTAGPSAVSDLRLEFPPDLRPYEVYTPGEKNNWDILPSNDPRKPSTLRIRFREPVRNGSFAVRCLAPLIPGQRWTSPRVHLRDSIEQSESVRLRVSPDVQLDEWDPGSFGIKASETTESGGQMLTLSRLVASKDAGFRPPSAAIRARPAAIRATSFSWWRAFLGSQTLTTRLQYESLRGQSFSLPIALPRGWQVDHVSVHPSSIAATWNVIDSDGIERLSVDLRRALPSMSDESGPTLLTLQLRPKNSGLQGSEPPAPIPFPQVTPIGAYLGEAILAISTDPKSEASVDTTAAPFAPSMTSTLGQAFSLRFFQSRGRAVEGVVRLRIPHNLVAKPGASNPSAAPPDTSPAMSAPAPTIERARMETSVLSDGRMFHSYEFELSVWHAPSLAVRLPLTATPLAVRVDGRLLTHLPPTDSPHGRTIDLPVRSGPNRQRFELLYRSSLPEWKLWARVEAPLPELPVPPASLNVSWRLPRGTEPFSEAGYDRDVSIAPLQWDDESTQWRSVSDSTLSSTLVVVRRTSLIWIGVGVAIAWSLLAFAVRRFSVIVRVGLLAMGIGVGIVGMWWSPGSLRPLFLAPLLVAGIAAMGWWVRSLRSRYRWMPRIATAVIVAVFCATGLLSQAPRPTPCTVYIIPDPTQDASKETVLVEPELVERLRAIIRRATSPVTHPVLVSARYDGTANSSSADVRAEYQVYCPSDRAVSLTLPLPGVRLHEALLDGAPVIMAHRRAIPPRFPEVYNVEVTGRGFHRLSLRFAVDASARGEEFDVRWNIPEIIQSQLDFEIHGSPGFARAIAHFGALRTTPGSPSSTRLEAHLGRVNNIHLQWQPKTSSHAPRLSVREAYLWSLAPGSQTLSALWQYTVDTGAINTLQVEVPDGLEVKSVDVHRLPNDSSDGSRPGLRDWSVSTIEGKRILRLDLVWPICRGVQVITQFVSWRPPISKSELPLPTPIDVAPTDRPDQASYIAYGSDGIRVELGTDRKGITRIDPAPFLELWTRAKKPEPAQRLHVYSFDRRAECPFVPVVLEPLSSTARAVQQMTWSIDRGAAEFRLITAVRASGANEAFLEWELGPEVLVGEVSGPEVRSWWRNGSRLQVWLQNGVPQTRIEIHGVHNFKTALREIPLPRARLISVPSTTTYVQVLGLGEFTPAPTHTHNLWPLPTNRLRPNFLEFATDAFDYGATFTDSKSDGATREQRGFNSR